MGVPCLFLPTNAIPPILLNIFTPNKFCWPFFFWKPIFAFFRCTLVRPNLGSSPSRGKSFPDLANFRVFGGFMSPLANVTQGPRKGDICSTFSDVHARVNLLQQKILARYHVAKICKMKPENMTLKWCGTRHTTNQRMILFDEQDTFLQKKSGWPETFIDKCVFLDS